VRPTRTANRLPNEVVHVTSANSSMQGPCPPEGYLDYSGRDDALSGGVRLIPVHTPKGDFRVWTKRIGNNPRVKVLLLHGGRV
jgi:hypothetical protein